MAIHYHHEELIQASPERVFQWIDDLPATSQWLPPCVSLEKIGAGPNQPGDQLRYVYRQGRREAEMEGQIVDRTPGERLHCLYVDKMFDVSVDLRVAPEGEGARTTHIITITPKTLPARIMQPLIRMGIGKQTRTAAGNLKRILEAPADA